MNDERNDDKRLKNLEKRKKFTSEYQPTPEAKSRGHYLKKMKDIAIEELHKAGVNMTWGELRDLYVKYKADNRSLDTYKPIEVRAILYTFDIRDNAEYFDRWGANAKKELDITTDGEKIDGFTIMQQLGDELKQLTTGEGEGKDDSSETVQE